MCEQVISLAINEKLAFPLRTYSLAVFALFFSPNSFKNSIKSLQIVADFVGIYIAGCLDDSRIEHRYQYYLRKIVEVFPDVTESIKEEIIGAVLRLK